MSFWKPYSTLQLSDTIILIVTVAQNREVIYSKFYRSEADRAGLEYSRSFSECPKHCLAVVHVAKATDTTVLLFNIYIKIQPQVFQQSPVL